MNPVVKIEIENILGIERLTVAPGALCVVSGGNGVGKTSLLEAVRAVMSEGHDASLLRAGTEVGAVRLTLADGSTMTKTITAKGSSFEGRHPKLGRISRARAWVDSVVDELGCDPLALVYCPPAKRAELLADLLVVNVSRADLEAAAPGFQVPAKLEGLDRIDAVRKAVYDERTAVNRTTREKRTLNEQLRQTLPAETGSEDNLADLRTTRARLQEESSAAQMSARSERERAEKAALKARESAIEGIRSNAQGEIDEVRTDAAERIRVIERERDSAITRIKERAQEQAEARLEAERVALANAEAAERKATETINSTLGVQILQLNEAVAKAEEREKEKARAEKTREIAAAASREADAAEERSKALSASIQRLDDLRARLLASLPVKGLEIREGQVFLDDVPFSRVNTARQIEVALQVAALRAKDVPLLVSDHGEALDSRNWEALRSTASALGMNVIIARRTDGPLAVETEQQEAA